MSTSTDPHHGSGHDHGDKEQDVHESLNHIVPPRIYILVGAFLLLMTGMTVLAATFDLGAWNPVIALFIACVKGTAVVLFFMHVKYSSRLTKLTVFSGLFTFCVLIALTLSDYMTRAWGRW